jgi:hypothetical protein
VSSRPDSLPLRAPASGRIADVLADNSLLVVLVAVLGGALLAVAPQLLVADSWMTLVAGREIAQHGLPSHEALTVMAQGHRWTDQQWLAQVVFYGADRLGGMRLAVFLDVALVTAALALGVAFARRAGASARATLIVAVFKLVIAPWSWQLRAQALALPIFVIVLALAASDVRRPRPMTFVSLPLVALWANLHGSVLVGAGVVSLAGVAGAVSRAAGSRSHRGFSRSLLLTLAPWVCVLASPYARDLPDYYRLMLFDSPVSKVIVEWQAPEPHGYYLLFFGFAAAATALTVWQRRRLGWYAIAVLAVTLAGSLRSGRGIVWFTLAALVLLPSALDGALGDRDVPIRRRLGLTLSATFLVVLAVAVVGVGSRPASWFEQEWPAAVPRSIAAAAVTIHGRKVVFPSDKHGDWLLWKVPRLRGRVAYDVRFELLDAEQLAALVRFKTRRRGWQGAARGYAILVFDPTEDKARIRAFRATTATTVLYKDDSVVVLRRVST